MAEETMQESNAYVCSLCKEVFSTKSHIIWHMLHVHKDNKTVRKLQNKKLQNSEKVTNLRDIKKSTTKKPQGRKPVTYKCSLCEYSTVHMTTWKRHSLTHNKNKKIYNCTRCSLVTHNLEILKRHMKEVHLLGVNLHSLGLDNEAVKRISLLIEEQPVIEYIIKT